MSSDCEELGITSESLTAQQQDLAEFDRGEGQSTVPVVAPDRVLGDSDAYSKVLVR